MPDVSLTRIAALLTITTKGDEEIDWSGFSSLRVRLQVGSADELEMSLPSQNEDGTWRPDLPVWQIGATLKVSAGWDGEAEHLQTFEIVSTTNAYPGGGDVPSMTVRGVSDLARAARNRNPRVFADKQDSVVLDSLCSEYGWTNGVDASAVEDNTLNLKSKFTKKGRIKGQGTTDLDMLRLIAADSELGGPRIDRDGALVMPAPNADSSLVFIRGAEASGDVVSALLEDSYALLSFSPSREGGADNVQLVIVAWDPESKRFVEKVYEADEFGGDPKVIFSGNAKSTPMGSESSTRGLTIQIIKSKGWNPDERRDVIATGRYINETDATDLARRYFNLREKLGRWATIEVDGHAGLLPYCAVTIDGDMAMVDKGYWLPTVVEHNFDDNGWVSRLTCIRIVEDSSISEAS